VRIFLFFYNLNNKLSFNYKTIANLSKFFTFYTNVLKPLTPTGSEFYFKELLYSTVINFLQNLKVFYFRVDKLWSLIIKKITIIFLVLTNSYNYKFFKIIVKFFLMTKDELTWYNYVIHQNRFKELKVRIKIAKFIDFSIINQKVDNILTSSEIDTVLYNNKNIDFYLSYLLYKLNKTIFIDFYSCKSSNESVYFKSVK
jgi:hypothetical protein